MVSCFLTFMRIANYLVPLIFPKLKLVSLAIIGYFIYQRNCTFRLDLLQKNMEDDMVEHYPLSEEQEKRLLFIDSEIDKYFSTMTTAVRNIDITYFERNNKLRKIQNEMNLEFKLRIAAMENDINKLKSTKFNEE